MGAIDSGGRLAYQFDHNQTIAASGAHQGLRGKPVQYRRGPATVS